MLCSQATKELTEFADAHDIPVVVTQAGKSAIDKRHPPGARFGRGHRHIGGRALAGRETDLLIAVGTRQDFCSSSRRWAQMKSSPSLASTSPPTTLT